MDICRFCGSALSISLIDLGNQPIANNYLKNIDDAETNFPLQVSICQDCLLVQLKKDLPPKSIFTSSYPYYSSFSSSWLNHAKCYAEKMISRFSLSNKSQVVEVASNDGYLLQNFVKQDIPVLGIDPASECAIHAINRGIPTEITFFDLEIAKNLRRNGIQADLMVANNVLAHVPYIRSFIEGFPELLKTDGVATFEFPHFQNLIEKNQFDTIYHEHYSYLSLRAVVEIFKRCGLSVFDVEKLETHGGSLRVFASRNDSKKYKISNSVQDVLEEEEAAKLESPGSVLGFQRRCREIRANLQEFLYSAKDSQKSVVAYGAAAKGNTLLNFVGLTKNEIKFVCDRSTVKQGLFLPGSRIPIVAPSLLTEFMPDYILILPWNLRNEISHSLSYVKDWNCKFVVAIPEVEVFQ